MPLLHIFDSSDSRILQTVDARGETNRVPISDGNAFLGIMDGLARKALEPSTAAFDRVLFETHGSSGKITFGNTYISGSYLAGCTGRGWANIVTLNARVYFNGCNVASDPNGWAFLEAAAAVFLTPGGGEVFGQTSLGFGNPFNGHVVHLWGSTRRLYVDQTGRIVERFEQ